MKARCCMVSGIVVLGFLATFSLLLAAIGIAQGPEPADVDPQDLILSRDRPGKRVDAVQELEQVTTTTYNVKLIGQLDGSAYAAMVRGNYAYVVAGDDGLRIVDISDPAQPQEVSVWTAQERVRDVYVVCNYAYVVTAQAIRVDGRRVEESELHVIDVSNPAAPEELGVIEIQGEGGNHVVGNCNYVYLTWSEYAYPFRGGLQIVDVSDPASPTAVGSYEVSNLTGSVYVSEDTAYLAWRSCSIRGFSCGGGLDILDVSNPSAPRKVRCYNTSAGAFAVQVVNHLAYVTTYRGFYAFDKNGIQIIDVSDLAAPVEVGIYHAPRDPDLPDQSMFTQDIYVAENFVYAAIGEGGLRVIDVSDPTEPTEIGLYVTPEAANGVYVTNDLIYAAYGENGLLILRGVPSVSASIKVAGGSLRSSFDRTAYNFPLGTFTDTVTVTHTLRFVDEVPPTGALANVGHFFEVSSVYESTGEPAQPSRPYTVTVQYTNGVPAFEDTLALYNWDGTQWMREPTSAVDTEANTVTATPDHFGTWAVLGEEKRMYLPAIFRNCYCWR